MSPPERTIVTGATGRIGRHLVAAMKASGMRFASVDRVPSQDSPTVVADLSIPGAAEAALKQVCAGPPDSLVHLAEIASPRNRAPEDIRKHNYDSTRHVLDAAVRFGISRIVLASSEAVLGFSYPDPTGPKLVPSYLPIDEAHPSFASDPYGETKLRCERLAAEYSHRLGISIVSLRFSWVWFPESYAANLAKATADAAYAASKLWSYVDVRDAVEAIRLALGRERAGHLVCFVAARDTFASELTEKLLLWHFPDSPRRAPLPGRSSLLDCRLARRELGFDPQHGIFREGMRP
jgi:UDP-glucose 4-epimerase